MCISYKLNKMKLNSIKIMFSTILFLSISFINTSKEQNRNLSNVSLLGDFSHFAESLFSDKLLNNKDEYFIEHKDISKVNNSNILRSSGNLEYRDLTRIISSDNYENNDFKSIKEHVNNEPKVDNKKLTNNHEKAKKNLKLKVNDIKQNNNTKNNISNTSNISNSINNNIQSHNSEVSKLKNQFNHSAKINKVNEKNTPVKKEEVKKTKSTEEILNEIYDDLV